MTLPEAIRAGALLHPQGHGFYFRHIGFTLHACAMAGAYEAATGRIDVTPERLTALWPELGAADGLLLADIAVWNDIDKHSREDIAGMVERRAR